MLRLKYRYCKVRMTAYISKDVSPGERRRIARYIDECPDCYMEYIRQLNVSRELERRLPVLGRPDEHRLERIWGQILTDITDSEAATTSTRPGKKRYSLSYGLVALILMLVFILPWIVRYREFQFVPSQPAPGQLSLEHTPTHSGRSAARDVALVLTAPGFQRNSPILQNTPAPMMLGS